MNSKELFIDLTSPEGEAEAQKRRSELIKELCHISGIDPNHLIDINFKDILSIEFIVEHLDEKGFPYDFDDVNEQALYRKKVRYNPF